MGQLNKAKNIQIAAMNAKGMTVEAIAKKSGVDAQMVKESLEQRERAYIELAAMSDEQIKEYIKNLQSKGRSTAEIAELTGYGTKKVNELIFGEQQPELELTKKELQDKAVRLHFQGKSIDEIVSLTGLSQREVNELVGVVKEDKPKRGGYNKTSEDVKDKVIELKKQGLSTRDVADKTGVARSTVWRIWDNYKNKEGKPSQINEEFDKEVDKMIEESKRKEPAPAATDTSSMKNEIKQLCNDDTTKTKESQALEAAKKKLLAIYETLTPDEARAWEMGEVYAEIVRGCE